MTIFHKTGEVHESCSGSGEWKKREVKERNNNKSRIWEKNGRKSTSVKHSIQSMCLVAVYKRICNSWNSARSIEHTWKMNCRRKRTKNKNRIRIFYIYTYIHIKTILHTYTRDQNEMERKETDTGNETERGTKKNVYGSRVKKRKKNTRTLCSKTPWYHPIVVLCWTHSITALLNMYIKSKRMRGLITMYASSTTAAFTATRIWRNINKYLQQSRKAIRYGSNQQRFQNFRLL